MTDAYGGRDSRRSNAPCGHMRFELVRITTDDTIVLSGSPIEYFVHPDYQNGDHEVTGTHKLGIAGIYNYTDVAWFDPDAGVNTVSVDGYTINCIVPSTIDVGDQVGVYYYATGVGTMDHQTVSQVGDKISPMTLDAVVQKLNDSPSLNFDMGGCLFDQQMCASAVKPVAGATTIVAHYTGAVGTWQATNTPFYVTSLFFGWNGDTIDTGRTGTSIDTEPVDVHVTVDSGTERTTTMGEAQHVVMPTGGGATNYDQGFFMNLGLVECNTDLKIRIGAAATFDISGGTFTTSVAGWYIP